GAWSSATLLAALAIGACLAALARRAPDRRAWLGASGALRLSIAIAALCALDLRVTYELLLFLPALTAIVITALAGTSIGSDDRSGPLASIAVVAIGLSFCGAAVSIGLAALHDAFAAMSASLGR